MPKKWWQWILIYPTIIISLLGYIPSGIKLIKSYDDNVPYDKIDEVLKQKKMWAEHSDCIRTSSPYVFTTQSNEKVSVTFCKDGDALFEVTNVEGKGHVKWIAMEDICTEVSWNLLNNEVYAQGNPIYPNLNQPAVTYEQQGKIMYKTTCVNNECIVEEINMITGQKRIVKRYTR